MDDFILRALIAGVALAIVTGPLGCVVVWRRMSAFGDTMSHSALLGVVLSTLFHIDLTIGVFATTALVALALNALSGQNSVAVDSLLAILANASLAIGMVLLGLLTLIRVDLMSFLFGDILAVSNGDVVVIVGGGIAILGILALIWRSLLAGTVSEDIARAEGLNPDRSRLIFMLLMAAVVAVAMKIVGVLLVTALLIIPATAARRLSTTPEHMAILASVIGALAVAIGLYGSVLTDAPTGPAIVVAGLIFFIACHIPMIVGLVKERAAR